MSSLKNVKKLHVSTKYESICKSKFLMISACVVSNTSLLCKFIYLGQMPISVSVRREERAALNRVLEFRTLFKTLKCNMAKMRAIGTSLSFVLMNAFTRLLDTGHAIQISCFCSFISLFKHKNIMCGQ